MLELIKEAFDKVTLFVKFLVIVALLFTPRLRWNNGFSFHLGDGFKDMLSVIGSVA